MSRTHISRELRERGSAQARHRCGYCLTAEAVVGTPMEVDHIIPEARGGATEEQNLWQACSLCNDYKNDRIAARDIVRCISLTSVPFVTFVARQALV